LVVGALALAAGCNSWFHDRCVDKECLFSRDEWTIVGSLANVQTLPPTVDLSNARLAKLLTRAAWANAEDAGTIDDPAIDPLVRLGWRLYHDVRLSGDNLSAKDSLGRPAAMPPARARPASETVCPGQLGISCATCHDPAAYGSDVTSQPPNVSSGAGWYDVNGQQTLNVARFFPVFYWNGRSDSLWSQAAQVTESTFSMNGHRLKTFRLVCQHYLSTVVPESRKSEGYDLLFADDPSTPALETLCKSEKVAALEDSSPTATPPAPMTGPPSYVATYGELDAHDKAVVNRVHVNASKAIAAYETFLTSSGSRFDQFYDEADKDRQATLLAPSEQRGLKLFIGHAGCVNCHSGPMFSDGQFHNIGVPQAGDHVPTLASCVGDAGAPSCNCVVPAEPEDAGAAAAACVPPKYGGTCLPVGAYAGWKKLHTATEAVTPPATTTLFRRCTCFDDDFAARTAACGAEDADGGVAEDDTYGCPDAPDGGAAADAGAPSPPPAWKVGAWRTPSLRDVAMTAPYMHDGVYATLEDVVWHYDQAPAVQDCTMGTSEIAPLNLTDQDRSDLVAFLGTLTGRPGPRVLIEPPDPGDFATCGPAGTDAGSIDGGTDGSVDAGLDGGTDDGATDAGDDAGDGGDGP
jgi:cytochrome c peroxidase